MPAETPQKRPNLGSLNARISNFSRRNSFYFDPHRTNARISWQVHEAELDADMDDLELVAQALNGNGSAFSELVRRYQPVSLKLATAVLGNREDAEDEVQNAMCKAFQHLDQFHQQSQFSTWLHRIVLNQSLMRLRQLRRHSAVSLDLHGSQACQTTAIELSINDESAEEKLSREQWLVILRQEVSHLPSVLRSALTLRDICELPFSTMAEHLGITVSAAKSRLLRARNELKSRLEQRYGRLSVSRELSR